MIKINACGLVEIFLNRYFTWKDCKQFYQNAGPSLISNDPAGIPVFYYADISNINSCKSNVIIIDCLTEGIHSGDMFNHYDPSKHYIIFANGNWNTTSHSTIKISYELVHSYYFMWDMIDTYCSPGRFCYYIDKDYKFDYPKSNLFTSTIGVIRPYRTMLVEKLKLLSYDNFILRYSGEDFGRDPGPVDVIEFTPGNFDPYASIVEKHYHNVSQTLPIDMYNQSYFNLLVETDIEYLDSFFPTEKIIKTLFTGMPFVLVGTPHFLKNLQSLGFTTYNQIWDESYDNEMDHYTRLDKIVELCQQLNTLDWYQHREQFEFIKLSNRNNFLNLQSIADQEFENFESVMSKYNNI